MSNSNAFGLPAFDEDEVVKTTRDWLYEKYRELERKLFVVRQHVPLPEKSPIDHTVRFLVRNANGTAELIGDDEFIDLDLSAAVQEVVELLCGVPFSFHIHIPNLFWDTPIGKVIDICMPEMKVNSQRLENQGYGEDDDREEDDL